MHIPDSVLSPITSVVTGVTMLPVWALALQKTRRSLGTRQTPLLALGAAFSFTVMLFNIPALGGTTAHPIAGTLLAVLLGPWAACIGLSVTLGIQALFFGDGGLLAYGANAFTMAFVLPFVGYSVFRLLARRCDPASKKIPLFAGIAAFVGINVSATVVAILLGIQPVLFHEPNGQALYFPFSFNVTLPAMLGTHLLIAGPVEAILTGLVVHYLQSAGIPLYSHACSASSSTMEMRRFRAERLWIGVLALIALSPLGLLAKGDAWGEWDANGVKEQTEKVLGTGKGYTPRGMEEAEKRGYKGIHGLEDYASGDGKNRLGYAGAGLLGVAAIALFSLTGTRLLVRRRIPGSELPVSEASRRPSSRTGTGEADALPDWLLTSNVVPPDARIARGAANRFLERTLDDLTKTGLAMTEDRLPQNEGFLQGIDARAKIITLLALVLAASLSRSFVALGLLYIIALLLASASRLSLVSVVRRSCVFLPLFIISVSLPLLFNPVTPGQPLLALLRQPLLTVTMQGLERSSLFTLRFLVVVTFALLLTQTTAWNKLLSALKSLGMPRIVVSILIMSYRYIVGMLRTVEEMIVARRSRTVGRMSNAAGRGYAGRAIGALFGKSLALSEEVHAAMISRGFCGNMRTLASAKWRMKDTLWTVCVLAFTAFLVWRV